MSGITANHAHAPEWKRLSEAAILEPKPEGLLERIVAARSAIHDRIEDGFSKPSDGEQWRCFRNPQHVAHGCGARD